MDGKCLKNVLQIEWVKKLSKFDERFIKNYDGNSDNGYFLEVGVEYSKNLLNLHGDVHFCPKEMKLKNVISLFVKFMTKKTMLYI